MRAARAVFAPKTEASRPSPVKKRRRPPVSCLVATLALLAAALALLVRPSALELSARAPRPPAPPEAVRADADYMQALNAAPPSAADDGVVAPSEKLVFVMDFWERMIHVHYALRRLTLVGLDAGFTVVEPFVYQSKATSNYSLRESFEAKGMRPQPASLYYNTDPLLEMKSLITHAEFRRKVSVTGLRDDGETSVVQAAVWVDWEGDREAQKFYWCDERIRELGWSKTDVGWAPIPAFQVQRVMCLNARRAMESTGLRKEYFDEMFRFAREGAPRMQRVCEKCIALAFINYRKHLFMEYAPDIGMKALQRKVPSLLVGKEPMQIAERLRKELLGGKPFVAIQMRTGKAFTVLELPALETGTSDGKYDAFRGWLKKCSMSLVSRAKEMKQKHLGDNGVFYIASDMYNDGWKGGEPCPPAVRKLLDETKDMIQRELGEVHRFEPEKYGVKQDVMGVSGAVDAAMGFQSDRFLYSMPSSFGTWVQEQRWQQERPHSVTVDCDNQMFKEFEHEKKLERFVD